MSLQPSLTQPLTPSWSHSLLHSLSHFLTHELVSFTLTYLACSHLLTSHPLTHSRKHLNPSIIYSLILSFLPPSLNLSTLRSCLFIHFLIVIERLKNFLVTQRIISKCTKFTSGRSAWMSISLSKATGYRRTSVVWFAAGAGGGTQNLFSLWSSGFQGTISSGIKCSGADDPTHPMQGLRIHRPLRTQENIIFPPILTNVSLMIAFTSECLKECYM
jgi:hypothetical protein